MSHVSGRRQAPGLRAAWERRQQSAELAAAVGRIPSHGRCKPALFAEQLQPVLAALRMLQQLHGEEPAEAGEHDPRRRAAARSRRRRDLRDGARRQLQRLLHLDPRPGANACLLLWLLLEGAHTGLESEESEEDDADEDGESEALAAAAVLLCCAMGWQHLLLEALTLLALTPQRQQQVRRGVVAAAAAATATGAGDDPDLLPAVEALVEALAVCAHRQLLLQQQQQHQGSGNGVEQRPSRLLSGVHLLQQVLLEGPPGVAAAPGVGAALRLLQGAADASMAQVMQSMQQQKQLGQGQQELFQQLCQLRARLALALAAAAPDLAHGGKGPASQRSIPPAALLLLASDDRDGNSSPTAAAEAWQAVLHMAAPAAGSTATTRSVASGSCRHPSRRQFLAACVAARCYRSSLCWQAGEESCGDAWPASCCFPTGSTSSSSRSLGLSLTIPALPGVPFQLPPLPAAGRAASAAAGSAPTLAALAEAAAAAVWRDPDCLGPVQVTLTSLHLAAQQQLQATAMEATEAEAAAAAAAPDRGTADWPTLLELAAAAAAGATQPAQQRQLLLLALHGQQPWLAALRRSLAVDAAAQARWQRELVAVANRLASDVSVGGDAGGSRATAVVLGEERRRRTEAAVAALLPHALLCPAAVLDRMVGDAVLHGGQVDLLVDILLEMRPLAAYCPPPPLGQQQRQQQQPPQPLLVSLLAALLAPSTAEGHQPRVLDVQGGPQALLELVVGLAGGRRLQARPGAAATGGGGSSLLSPALLLRQLALPGLERSLQGQHGEGDGQLLLLPLQLVDGLLEAAEESGGAAGLLAGAEAQQLTAVLQGLMDLDARRVDASSAALQASGEVYELAASVLHRLDSGGGNGCCDAGAYFLRCLARQQTEASAEAPAAAAAAGGVRQRLVPLLAAMLPCCTAVEARQVLLEALPAAAQALLLGQPLQTAAAASSAAAAGGVPQAGIQAAAHAAAVEAACRAARQLALRADLAPIAGEEDSGGASGAAGPLPGEGPLPPPSALRQVAVERLLQHLTQHCARLADAAAATTTGAGQALPPQQDRPALALRCFRELCQLAAAVQARRQYDCATLQAGLLQLVRTLGAAPGGQQEALEAQVRGVAESLLVLPAVAEGGEWRLREVVLLGIQQTWAQPEQLTLPVED